MLQIASHLPHAGTVGTRLLVAITEDAHIFGTQMPVRAERNFAKVGKVSRFDRFKNQHVAMTLGAFGAMLVLFKIGAENASISRANSSSTLNLLSSVRLRFFQ
jgi:hypothetical protein